MKEINVAGTSKKAQVDDWNYERTLLVKWWIGTHGYPCGKPNGEFMLMHQFLFGKAPRGMEWHHRDDDEFNNTEANVVLVTHSQNKVAQRPRTDGKSKYKGICWDSWSGKWIAATSVNGKYVNVGRFTDEIEAAKAYDKAVRKLHGELAYVNFPEELDDESKRAG